MIEWLESEALGQTQGVLLWAGIVLAFWPVTMGTRLLTKAFNAVFEVEETHPAWRRVASSLTLAPRLALVVITAVGLMLFTSRAIVWLSCLLPFRYKALVSPCKFPANQIPTLRFRALLVEEALRWSWRWCGGGRFRVLLALLEPNKRYVLVGKRTFREDLSSRRLGE